MFGNIIDIDDNKITLVNLKQEAETNILNYHVIFAENDRKVVGEIVGINNEVIKILLVGEIKNDIFTSGVIKKPSFKTPARLIYKSELELILGSQDIAAKENLLIGKSTTYEGYNISTKINDFFTSHFAIVGNTGAGKSCGVARILQNIFYHNDEAMPINAHIVLFDAYGEYNSAFSKMNSLPNLRFKHYTTNTGFDDSQLIKIPAYFLDVDDLALLLNCKDSSMLPIIEQALKLVYIFTSENEQVVEYKNDIIAKSLQDILASGKNSTQIRDQIIAVLSKYNTDTLNLDTIISQPGYNRTIRQCLNIDAQGKMNSVGFVVDFLQQYSKVDLEKIESTADFTYTLDDLYYALEFALIGEGILSSETIYEKANQLKVRLHAITNSDSKKFFEFDKKIGKEQYIKEFFTANDGMPAQIVNVNFNYIDERFAKVLTKIFARLFFNYTVHLTNRASFPIHIIIEEAHRYVQNDNDLDLLGYNIFDRITKEGRKYGVILGLITQRPSELSTTSLSQCSNFIAFRMFHPADINIISNITSNVSNDTIERIKTLRPGMAMAFGTAFKVPLIAKLDLPDPMPASTSVDIEKIWY